MPNTCQSRNKRTYSTFTKYCCQKGVLSPEIAKEIPRSTRHTWLSQKVLESEDTLLAVFEKQSLDYAELFAENEKTKILCNALKDIISLYRKIIDNCEAKKQVLSKSKNLIIDTAEQLKNIYTAHQLCMYLGISAQQFHAWKNNKDCAASLLKLCRKKFPTQLTEENLKVIKTYLDNTDFQFLSRATIYWKIIRDGAAAFSKSVFYKYCRLLGYKKRPVLQKSKQNAEGVKAIAVAEILHTDITYVITADDKTSYLSFVEDNFSKFILSGKASQTPTAEFIKTNIEHVANAYNLHKPKTVLITDNGSENKGALDTYLQTEGQTIKKIVARVDIPEANNVVEALHKKFKNEFLQGKKFANHEALVTALPNLIEAYNNQYHDSLYGLTPLEVWNGAMPDKNKYKPVLAAANENRKQANKKLNCGPNIRTF